MDDRDDQSLESIVGKTCYAVWLDMLRQLVPDGRTHRIGTLIAGMLQYANEIALEQTTEPEEGSAAWSLTEAEENGDPDSVLSLLSPIIERLYDDAGVSYKRTSAKGARYTMIDSIAEEFLNWSNMPWE